MFEHVQQAVSADRLGPYLAAADDDPQLALRIYEWNSAVSATFHRLLEQLEVALRNAIHRELSLLTGDPMWWDSPAITLINPGRAMVRQARTLITQRDPDRIVSAGDVVASLPFGFWVSLFGNGRSANYEMTLWRPGLRLAFPGFSGTRQSLHLRLNSLRLLRNRVAHHEPIFRRHLEADHGSVLGLLGDISPGFAAWVAGFDDTPVVLARRPGRTGGQPT